MNKKTKKAQHPELRDVVYLDVTNGQTFKIESAAATAETIVWTDGVSYPLVKVEVSSASHPAFNGKGTGDVRPSTRTEEFRKKYARMTAHDVH